MKFFQLLLWLAALLPAPLLGQNAQDTAVRAVLTQFEKNWISGNAQGVLDLFEPNARVVVNEETIIDSIEHIRAVWFPDKRVRTSKTTQFKQEIIAIDFLVDLAFTIQKSTIEWSYQHAGADVDRISYADSRTILHRQTDGSWKIAWFSWIAAPE